MKQDKRTEEKEEERTVKGKFNSLLDVGNPQSMRTNNFKRVATGRWLQEARDCDMVLSPRLWHRYWQFIGTCIFSYKKKE